MENRRTNPVQRLALLASLTIAAATIATISVSAHRVIGRAHPTLATALVQSPTASPADLPVPLFSTGLSVACIRVSNTSPGDVRLSAVGLELPGTLSGFALVTPLNRGLRIEEGVQQVPGFPGVTLDVAVVAGSSFSAGRSEFGLAPGQPAMTICLSGPFDPAVPIETALNGVFVRFDGGVSSPTASDIGVWERR